MLGRSVNGGKLCILVGRHSALKSTGCRKATANFSLHVGLGNEPRTKEI